MAKVSVLKKTGKKAEEIEVSDAIFNARINKRLLDDVVRLYGNNKRSGTSSTKTFGEVRGGGKRPWRQKGTGRARSSSIRNPLWRGGGTIHGPRPRDINYSIPQKMRLKAIISALSSKNKDGNIIVVEDLALKAPKTKEFYEIIKALKLQADSVLCVVGAKGTNILRAARNVDALSLKSAEEFNAYHVMRKKKILIEKEAVQKVEERLKDIT
ncbi:MAG: 50S ribosomal protein L4 [Candidatus Omnitrophica bacterium]|nr:50S ribosomal protein L4 [Candidatus Omnitrophota bacterium]